MARKVHNERGIKSNALGGYGRISEKGHRRIWDIDEKRYRMEHDVIWETIRGKLLHGTCIHHKNENKLDNRIENLEAVPKRFHDHVHVMKRKGR